MDFEQIQEELEDEMVSRGADRYAVELERGLQGTGPGKELMRRAIAPMAALLEETFNGSQRHAKRGTKYIKDIHPFVLADITMRRVLDCAAKGETLTKTAKAVATAVEWHVKDASLRAASVSIWNKTQEKLKMTQNPSFRRASIDGTVAGMREWAQGEAPELAEKLAEVRGLDWDIEQQVEVGSMLIDHFARCTDEPWFTIETIPFTGRKTKMVLQFTPGTQEWLEKQHEYHAILRPAHLPMVVPPTCWSDLKDGGYMDNSKAGVSFIKTRARGLGLDDYDLDDAYEAVNRIQATPWRVNQRIWSVMNSVWESGSGLADVPPRFTEDGRHGIPMLPMRLQDMSKEDRRKDDAYRAWALRARAIHESNAALTHDVKAFGDLMAVATRFAQYPAFYQPHKLDFRGRVYPISMFLSPQGDQFNRALIEFADGKRMGDSENSGAWLCIHGANVFGVDKVSFEKRLEFIEDHHNEIIESAYDPFGNRFWTTADKPWPFLAFCFEYLAWQIAGADHITHLPVALDGSNSGLQHLSAMLRDSNGAKITCVAPGEAPEDVYQMVADQVEASLNDTLTHDLTDPDDKVWASIWAGKVSRKICKQPTMTYTYSATVAGMKEQIFRALKSLDTTEQSYLSFTDPRQTNADAADYLAPLVRAAIAAQMTKAAEAMDFLQQCARTFSKTGLPLRWHTPLNVPVVQYYPTATSKKKEVFINGQRHQVRLHIDSASRLDKKRAAAGVSPNFVHSMDATHLMWTVLYSHDEHGIEDFSMIHDSFGTHATNIDGLAHATREMFVALYSEDRLSEFQADIASGLSLDGKVTPDELPDVPEYGDFDINEVLNSDYFFA